MPPPQTLAFVRLVSSRCLFTAAPSRPIPIILPAPSPPLLETTRQGQFGPPQSSILLDYTWSSSDGPCSMASHGQTSPGKQHMSTCDSLTWDYEEEAGMGTVRMKRLTKFLTLCIMHNFDWISNRRNECDPRRLIIIISPWSCNPCLYDYLCRLHFKWTSE